MTITKEGALASFYTMNKAPIKHLRVYFSPKQAGEGTPSPSNVRAISGWTGLTAYKTGKNLLDPNSTDYNNYTIGPSGEIINTSNDRISTDYIPIEPNKSITASGNVFWYGSKQYIFPFVGIAAYTKNKEYIKRVSANLVNYITLTTPADTAYIRFFMQYNKNDNPTPQIFHDLEIQLELGSTATEYESYTGTTLPLDWSSTAEIIYGGYVDLVTGELVQNIYSVDSSLWRKYRENNGYNAYIIDQALPARNTTTDHLYLSNIISSFGSFNSTNMNKNIIQLPNYCALQSDVDISQLQYMYKLATPIIHQLTPTQLSTLIGRNNIWSNADRVEVEYDLAESNDELYRRRNILLRSAPHIETVSGSLAHFETDLVAPLKECKIAFEPVQEGTGDPSPDNIRPISGWTGLTAYRTGKNLIDTTVKAVISNTRVSLGGRYGYPDIALSAGTYTLAIGYNSISSYNVYYRGESDSEGIKIASASTIQTPYVQTVTFTLTNTEGYYFWVYRSDANGGAQIDNIAWFTLVEGSEPFIPTTMPVTFPVAGKNLVNTVQSGIRYKSSNYFTYLFENQTITFNITTAASNFILLDVCRITSDMVGKKYVFSMSSSWGNNSNSKLVYCNDDGSGRTDVTGGIITQAMIGKMLTVRVYPPSKTGQFTVSSIQVEQADSPTTYEPFTNTYYGGYVDLINGELVVEWYKMDITSLYWYKWGSAGLMYNNHTGTPRKANTIIYCNNAIIDGTGDPQRKGKGIIGYYLKDIRYPSYLFIQTDIATSTSDGLNNALAYINETFANTYIVFQLENPIRYQLSSQTLKTLHGHNNIWSNANGPVEIKYWRH